MAIADLISQESTLVGTIVNNELTTTGLSVDVEFKDSKTQVAREPQSTTLHFVIDKDNSNWEMIKADSHSTTGGVTTITINASGRAIPKFGTGSGSGTGNRHPVGSQIGCVYTHNQVEQVNDVLKGLNATGANNFRVGDETDSDIKIFAQNGDANKPFLMYDASENQWVFSNDGTSTTDVGGGTGSISGGDGITVTAGVVAVDLTDTNVFVTTSSGAADSGLVPLLDANGKLPDGFVDVSQSETEVTYTAIEDIAIGKPAAMTTTADNVENIIASTLSTGGTEATFEAGATTIPRVVNIDRNTFAAIYADGGDSKGYAVVGTSAGDGKTITWGTPQEITATAITATGIAKMSTSKVAFVYTYGGANYLRVATVAGTVLTFGSESGVGGGAATYNDVALLTTDKVICCYDDAGAANAGKAKAVTVTGTTIGTFGSASTFEAGGTDWISVAQNGTDEAIVAFTDAGDSDKGKVVLMTVSGTAISTNSAVEFEANAAQYVRIDKLAEDSHVVVWTDATDSEATARIASTSGLSVSFPTAETAVASATSLWTDVVAISSTVAYIVYEDSASSDGKFNRLAISGTTITAGSQNTFNGTNNVSNLAVGKVNGNEKIVILYRDEADSNKGNSVIYQSYNNIRNVVGFASQAISAGAAGPIRSKGVIGNQTSLTAGTEYFFGTDGSISSTDGSGVRVGIAKDTDELDIDIDQTMEEAYDFFSTTDITGAEAEALADGSSITSHSHSNQNKLLNKDLTQNAFTGNAEETVYTYLLPGGTLGTANGTKTTVLFSDMDDNGSATGTQYKLKYGSTTVATIDQDTEINSYVKIEAYLFANADTAVQKGYITVYVNDAPAPNNSSGYIALGTAAEDSTGDLALTITVKCPVAGSSMAAELGYTELLGT